MFVWLVFLFRFVFFFICLFVLVCLFVCLFLFLFFLIHGCVSIHETVSSMTAYTFKGRVMDRLLVLVCPCFRENVIVTFKIVSSLCSLDNFSLENVIVFIFGN